jgi:hypothetical protein
MSKQHFYPFAVWVVLALTLSISAGCSVPWERATPTVEAKAVGTTEVATSPAPSQSVYIVSPLNGSVVTQNQPVPVRVRAAVPQVEAAGGRGIDHFKLFYKKSLVEQPGVTVETFVQDVASKVEVAEDSAQGLSSYQGDLVWTPPEAGSQTITVWAYDQDGKSVVGPASVLVNVMPNPPATEFPTPTPRPPCSDDASLEWNSVSDGLRVLPGTAVNATWRIRNTGTCQWDSYYKLAFVDGNRMEGEESFVVPGVIGGQGTVEFTAHLHAPQDAGIYEGRWRMKNPNGDNFGENVYVRIEVVGPTPTLTPTPPTPTPSVTPTPRLMIRSFSANPTTIDRGQSSTLSWEVEGASQIYLYPEGGWGLPSVGSRIVSPDNTTTYLLVATYDSSRDERQLTITVEEPALPDLVVEDVGLSPDNYIRFRVRNAGQGHVTQSFRIHVEKSGVGIWDYDVPGLSAGQSLSFEVDRDPVAGRERVRVVADSLNAIEETQKNNNEVSVELSARQRVTVYFTQVTIHNDGTPEGNGQLAFRFRVNGQEKRYPLSGYTPVGDGNTLPLSEQIVIAEMLAEQDLDILVQGLLSTASGGEVSLGQVHTVYHYADARWQAGQHNELSSEGNGSFTIYYTISVE